MKKYLIITSIFILGSSVQAAKLSLRQKSEAILQSKCMDCHSTKTVYPWYYNLPGAKQLMDADIDKGRAFLNLEDEIFSAPKERDISQVLVARLEAVVQADSMPPIQYKAAHWDKILSKSDKQTLLIWLSKLKGTVLVPLPEVLVLEETKVLLGEKLFQDTRLSRDNTLSCATCHDLDKGGTDRKQFSTGIGGAKGHINSPTVYNASFNFKQFWDGRAETLEAQAHGPVHNPREMGSNWDEVIAKLKEDPELIAEIKSAYALEKNQEITGDMLANAITEFEKSLVTPNSPFDQYLRGDLDALNSDQKRGLELFKKYNCTICHSGPALGANSFQKMGARRDYCADRVSGANNLVKMAISKEDYGRMNVTHNDADKYKFKVPTLRNVSLSYPYFHDGSVKTLDEAVRIMGEYQVGKKIKPDEIKSIVSFLKSLTDEGLVAD